MNLDVNYLVGEEAQLKLNQPAQEFFVNYQRYGNTKKYSIFVFKIIFLFMKVYNFIVS